MAKITRQEARDILFGLLFENEFHCGEDPTYVYELACKDRDIPQDKYIKETFFGVITRIALVDEVISKYSKGWRADRLSKVSRTVIRIAVYEMLFVEDIPHNVSISQAVELAVKYGEDKAKQFVNGVLSGIFKDAQAGGVDSIISEAAAELEKRANGEKSSESAECNDNNEDNGADDAAK